ncbi:MAG: glycosyltransferase [Lewinellaceae bacterium]|nr:glycosyltransferase [Saprospiraceae bacterium]MCB9330245.1 glycosyltransferase [Lewinellaceae bacterium]
MPTIICTVTNDLSYDQRMQRICSTLAERGYRVTLLGRVLPHSLPLKMRNFEQHRLRCRFNRGMLFYAEFNLRLLWYLMRANYDATCSVDLDTLAAGCLAGVIRRKKRVFDAHEYFTEVPEVTGRPVVKLVWSAVARLCLPFYQLAYTVGPALAAIFEKKYRIPFGVVRNVAEASPAPVKNKQAPQKVLLYQGALNEGRGIEQALQAMQQLDGLELWLAGEGDLSETLRNMASELGVQDKVRFLGRVQPEALKQLTPQAWLGLNVLENKGLSYYYSLANKFFDYIQAGVPQLTMNFPEYRALNTQHEVALMLDVLSPEAIVSAVRQLLENPETYAKLQRETLPARQAWSWEKESAVLLQLWEQVFAVKK